MAKRTQIQKQTAKNNAKKLLERKEKAEIYEKGLIDAAKHFAAGSFFPVDVAEGVSQGAFTPPASYKAAMMRPPVPSDYQIDEKTGKPVFKGKPPVVNPEYKGTTEHVGKQLGVDIADPGGLAPQVFSPDPFAKLKALGILGKAGVEGLAGLGALYGGLKKVGKGEKAEDVAKPIFTSPGKSAAADISKETIPANKVKNQLEGRGVSKDEMEWTGFNDWIKTKKGEVSKAEIEEFFEQNQIQVQEVVKGSLTSDAEFRKIALADTADELRFLMSNDQELYTHRNHLNSLIDRLEDGTYTPEDSRQLNEWFKKYGHDDEEYVSSFYERALNRLSDEDVPGQVRYPQKDLQLPGGENYRELLLRVPAKQVPRTKENVTPLSIDEIPSNVLANNPNSRTDFWYFNTPHGIEKVTKDFPNKKVTQEEAIEIILDRASPLSKPRFTSGHWEESDVIAHIRFNERVDPDGNKVLFIEEIQSDWAHKGKDVGFKTPETEAARIKLENVKMKITQIDDQIRSLALEEGALQSMAGKGPSDYKKIATVKKEKTALEQERTTLQLENLDLIDKRKSPVDPIQPGPFVTDAHQWTNLALKRMIRWASDEGFDSIAWVTGKQSADRYKASKHISKIEYNSNGVLHAYDKNGITVITEFDVTPEKLPNYIGKEPANRLLKQDAIPATQAGAEHITYQSLEGLDMDIGGEYHKFIYDKVLTDQAKKIGKKHGAKVEAGSIEGGRRGLRKFTSFPDETPRWRMTINDELVPDSPAFDDFEKAKQYIFSFQDSTLKEKVWTMRLTDKLKEASREGLPYYMVLPPLVIGGAAAQRTDAQKQQAKTDAQAILAQ